MPPRECGARLESDQTDYPWDREPSQLHLHGDTDTSNTTTAQTAVFVDTDVGNVVTYDSLPTLATNDMQDQVDLSRYWRDLYLLVLSPGQSLLYLIQF
jgi:hypothetical protein